jgi:hypothetical protein
MRWMSKTPSRWTNYPPTMTDKSEPDRYNQLYDAVTAQLEHEFDVLGYEGNTDGVESLERIKAAVVAVRDSD